AVFSRPAWPPGPATSSKGSEERAPVLESVPAALAERRLEGFVQSLDAGFHVGTKMYAQHATLALAQRQRITQRLGIFQHAEGVFFTGNRHILLVVAGDEQKHSGIRTALMQLTGGMQKTRTKAHGGRHVIALQDSGPQSIQRLFVVGIAI